MGGFYGDRLREIAVVVLPLDSVLVPGPTRALTATNRGWAIRLPDQRVAHSPRAGPEVAARAEREGLRAIARHIGVSHETVRAMTKWVKQGGKWCKQLVCGNQFDWRAPAIAAVSASAMTSWGARIFPASQAAAKPVSPSAS
jgi:hypothetical protein